MALISPRYKNINKEDSERVLYFYVRVRADTPPTADSENRTGRICMKIHGRCQTSREKKTTAF